MLVKCICVINRFREGDLSMYETYKIKEQIEEYLNVEYFVTIWKIMILKDISTSKQWINYLFILLYIIYLYYYKFNKFLLEEVTHRPQLTYPVFVSSTNHAALPQTYLRSSRIDRPSTLHPVETRAFARCVRTCSRVFSSKQTNYVVIQAAPLRAIAGTIPPVHDEISDWNGVPWLATIRETRRKRNTPKQLSADIKDSRIRIIKDPNWVRRPENSNV